MKIVDINSIPEHEPFYMFTDNENGVIFIVSEDAYERFKACDNNGDRLRVADLVILSGERRVVKSRHF